MKKVAFVTPNFPVLSETFIRTEIEAIQACGHKVCVLTFHKHLSAQRFNYHIYEIGQFFSLAFLRKITVRQFIQFVRFILSQQSMPRRSLFLYSIKLASQLAKLNVEHVHSHFAQHSTSHSIAAARLIGITSSFVGHGHDVYESPFDIKVKIDNSDFAVTVCNDMRKDFLNLSKGNIKLLHCGVKTQLFKPQPKIKFNKIRLVFIGRLIESKGLPHLLLSLQTLCKLYPISLDIIGDGKLAEELKQQSAELGLTSYVHFLGAKEPKWVQENLPQYDCLVAPFCTTSSGLVDTGPLVLKEAMAVGLPVITTNIMGCKEIVAPGTGFAIEQKNVAALASAIERFIKLPEEKRHQMGKQARQNIVDNFDAKKQAQILSGWIENPHQYSQA